MKGLNILKFASNSVKEVIVMILIPLMRFFKKNELLIYFNDNRIDVYDLENPIKKFLNDRLYFNLLRDFKVKKNVYFF